MSVLQSSTCWNKTNKNTYDKSHSCICKIVFRCVWTFLFQGVTDILTPILILTKSVFLSISYLPNFKAGIWMSTCIVWLCKCLENSLYLRMATLRWPLFMTVTKKHSNLPCLIHCPALFSLLNLSVLWQVFISNMWLHYWALGGAKISLNVSHNDRDLDFIPNQLWLSLFFTVHIIDSHIQTTIQSVFCFLFVFV